MEKILVGRGFAFSLRRLACLEKFIRGPMWVLGSVELASPPERMAVSLTVQDFNILWGPMWMQGGTSEQGRILRAEGGYIIPLPPKENHDISQEIKCHWVSDEDTQSFPLVQGDEGFVLLHNTSQVLIGADNTSEIKLTINPKCKSWIPEIQQRIPAFRNNRSTLR